MAVFHNASWAVGGSGQAFDLCHDHHYLILEGITLYGTCILVRFCGLESAILPAARAALRIDDAIEAAFSLPIYTTVQYTVLWVWGKPIQQACSTPHAKRVEHREFTTVIC